MTETTLNEILEDICSEEVSEYEKVKPRNHFFSFRHRNAMEDILYPHHCSEEISDKRGKMPIHKRFIILTIVIIMAVMSITAGGAMLRGFNRKEFPEYTRLLAANANNCPKTIENVYYIPEIPEGFEFYGKNCNISSIDIIYKNTITKRRIIFEQTVKEIFTAHFDNEYTTFEEVDINGKYGLFQKPNDEYDIYGSIVWDNEDYILQISGNFTKDELLKLAESVKLMDGGIENDRNNTQ